MPKAESGEEVIGEPIKMHLVAANVVSCHKQMHAEPHAQFQVDEKPWLLATDLEVYPAAHTTVLVYVLMFLCAVLSVKICYL